MDGMVCMDNKMERLFEFCHNYPYVVCYGASDHGYCVKHFLENGGIKVKAFLVSDRVKENEVRDGLPVFSVQDCKIPLDKCGIVLSMYERHHQTVKRSLGKYCKKYQGIYALKSNELKVLRVSLINMRRDNILFSRIVDIDEINRKKYNDRIRQLQKKYSVVTLRYIDVRRLGGIALWIYYCWEKEQKKNRRYYLYYPVTHEHRPEEELAGVNECLLQKLTADGIEVISKKNVSFWRYFLKKRIDFFSISNKYATYGWNNKFCEMIDNIECNGKLYVKLDENELLRGKKQLYAMDVTGEFVCISSRDPFYLQTLMRDPVKSDFRDDYRNSDIQRCVKAAEYLKKNRIRPIRIGAAVDKSFIGNEILDYTAMKYRTEFMDLYLVYTCKFFISDLSGIQTFAMLFSKPMVILNAPLLTTRFDFIPFFSLCKDIAIFKKLWDSKNNRYLTIREMLKFEVDGFRYEENIGGNTFRLYKEQRIIPVDNTAMEIFEVVKEMNERLDGIRKYTDEEERLQTQYRKIVEEYPKKENVLSSWRIGTEFLKKNKWLLD